MGGMVEGEGLGVGIIGEGKWGDELGDLKKVGGGGVLLGVSGGCMERMVKK